MAMYPKPPAPKKSSSASRQTGGKAKESMPGVRGSGEMMALKGTGKAKSGASMPKEKQAGYSSMMANQSRFVKSSPSAGTRSATSNRPRAKDNESVRAFASGQLKGVGEIFAAKKASKKKAPTKGKKY